MAALFEHRGDDLPDAREGNPSGEKLRHRHLVGRIEHGRRRATPFRRLPRQRKRGKNIITRFFEVQPGETGPFQRRQRARDAIGPGERILDREPHVRMAHLGKHGSIHELDHRMHDALRVDDDIDPRDVHVEKPARLDHLQPLVEHRGRIDGDFFAHPPRRMAQRFLPGHRPHLVLRPGTERSAGCGENKAPHLHRVASFQALENRVVLAVHRENPAAKVTRGRHDQLTGDHEHFLAGQRDVFAGLERGEGRTQPPRAHDGDQHHVRAFPGGQLLQPAGAGENGHRLVIELRPQFQLRGRVRHRQSVGPQGVRLHREPIDIAEPRHPDHAHPPGQLTGHPACALPDRAGRAENHDVAATHEGNPRTRRM